MTTPRMTKEQALHVMDKARELVNQVYEGDWRSYEDLKRAMEPLFDALDPFPHKDES